MDEILHRLGQRIREIRLQRGFTSQDAFAHHIGLHRAFVGHLETGRKDFRLTTIIRVADTLGVTLSELFAGLESGDTAAPKPAKKSGRAFGSGLSEQDRKRILKEIEGLERTARTIKDVAQGHSQVGASGSVVPKQAAAKKQRRH